MNKLIITIIFAVIIFAGCGTKKTENSTDNVNKQSTDSLKFEKKELLKTVNNCKPGDEKCTYIKLSYIEASSGKAKDKINALINQELITAYEMPDKNLNNTKLMMDSFIKDFEAFTKQFPDAPQVWTVDYNAKVYSETGKILCLSFENSSYLGGAHPSSFTVYRNINKETGDTISLVNLFGSGFEDKLNTLIDKKFREMKKLKPGDNLQENGDLFENSIKLNYNFSVPADKGLEFYYNPYEIAPYAVGPIVVKLSSSDIAGLLTAGSPLK